MLEESMSTVPSSIWASIFSWFTPTVFFVFLNLTIGTIYFTSSLASNKPGHGGVGEGQRQEEDETDPKLVRSPSVLQRLKSINLYSYRSQEPVTTAYEKVPDVVGDFHFSFQQQTSTPEQDQRQQQPYLDRSPSVLQRLKSVNLYRYFSPEPTSLHKTQEIYSHYTPEQEQAREEEDEQVQEPEEEEEEEEEEVEEENQGVLEEEEEKEEEDEGIQGEEQTLDEIYSQLKDSHVTRTKSDAEPASGELPTKLPRKMRKSASVKSAFPHFEEDDILETRLRPATMREGKAKATEEDDEVDAKADDFINKFKQQLKLQRMDSIVRYKEMVNRGSER